MLICAFSQSYPPQNPVIGVFTQTLSNTTTNKSSYIAASYVKFIELAGAQVVPIYSFANTSDILTLLSKINGVLFPGK
jgi:gamma-glutamyl hydrolase